MPQNTQSSEMNEWSIVGRMNVREPSLDHEHSNTFLTDQAVLLWDSQWVVKQS